MELFRHGLRSTARSATSTTFKAILAVLLLAASTSTVFAVNTLTATPASVTLTCNTATGPGTNVSIVVKPVTALTGSATIVVSIAGLPAGVSVVTAPSTQTLSTANQAAGITYVINYAPGCVGATAGTPSPAPTFKFKNGSADDVTVTANTTVTAAASGLVAAPSTVTVTCVKSGSSYTPSAAKTVSITGPASGVPFTIDTTTNPPAAWLTLSSGAAAGGTATGTPVTFTVQAASGCGGFSSGTTNTTTLHLLNAPAPDKLIAVSLQVVTPTPLVATPAAPHLSYVKGNGTPGYVDVSVTSASNPAPFFSVDTTTLPIWLTVDAASGKVPKTVRFSSTVVADNMAPGTYSASVGLKVSGSGDLMVPITILITNPVGRLTVAEGTTRNINWTLGQAAPSAVITAVSTDSPISYTATTGGTLAPVISANQLSGLAYSFGTQIGVTFDPTALAAAQPGMVLTGTVTLTWGNPVSTTVVTFNLTVQVPGATVTSLMPASIPTSNPGQSFQVVITGSGFTPSTDPTQRTRVGVVVNNALVADSNISWNVVNASNIVLAINVPATADPYLAFSPTGTGGTVTLGVCNPMGTACTVPTGTAVLTIGSGPIIQVVTSASSFIQVNPGQTPSVAPYDIVSVFGTNFCSSGGTGCSSSQILYGTPDAALRYPTSLSPDAVSATQRLLSVKFQTHGASPTLIANANLLFATNNQINLMVPSTVTPGTTVDIVVSFGYGTGATMLNSIVYPVNVLATNPGIFTIGADGQGQAAALDSADYTLITAGNEAGMRSTPADSDIVLLYVTGLGKPDSTGATSGWSSDCTKPADYVSNLNAQTGGSLATADGLIIQPSLLTSAHLSPCLLSGSANAPTVTIGGVSGTVSYAGWVANSIAGLYQINVKLPGSAAGPFTDANGATLSAITAPVQLPVVITSNSLPSQAGVTMWVTPRLKVVAPTALTGTVGIAWPSSNNLVVASEGASSSYRYAVTSGLLPSGLTLNAATGAISGMPAANTAGTYQVTVTATDTAHVPVTGSVSFTLTINGGLYVVASGTAPYTWTFGTSHTMTTVTATSGVYPYVYSITSPASLPVGMTVNAGTGVVGISALTPAGTYHVTVSVTDSTSGTPLTGSASFDIVVALHVASTTLTPAGAATTANASMATVSATGNTGTVGYTLDTASAALGWLSISSGGVLSTTNAAAAGTYQVTVTATDDTADANAASPGTGTITLTLTIS